MQISYFIRTSCLAAFILNVVSTAFGQDAPSITTQPQSQTVVVPNSVTFTVGASGTSPLTYQWYYTNSLVTNALGTASSYTIPTTQRNSGGRYFVVVGNSYGTATSDAALLTVEVLPGFYSQPVSCSAPLGTSASFSFNPSGTYPFSYQWLLNGSPVASGTVPYDGDASTYTTPPITAGELGTYSVVISNAAGTATSSNAVLAVGPVSAFPDNMAGSALYPPPTDVIAMAGGASTTVLLHSDGTLSSYGPLASPPLTNVVAIASTSTSTSPGETMLALLADGTVYGWGTRTSSPLATNIVAISAGRTSLYLRRDGTVLSDPDTNTVPTMLRHVVQVASGISQNMALRENGTVVVWDQLGSAATNIPPSATNLVAIASGFGNCLGLKDDGRLVTWGSNYATNIPPLLTNAATPGVAAITSNGRLFPPTLFGQYSALALLTNGTVVAWGSDAYGQTNVPLGLTNVVSIAQGTIWSLALVNDGTPQIIQPPVGGTLYSGRDEQLRARVVGNAPLSYQWTFNGTNIVDATNSVLALPHLQGSDAGVYQLLVTNALGSTASVPVPVRVIDSALYFTVQPISRTTYVGDTVDLGVSVNGSGPLQIQWRFANSTNSAGGPDWHDLPGVTNEDLIFNPVDVPNVGSYSVVASNFSGALTSATITLNVRQVVAWGDDNNGVTNVPASLTNAIAISAGNFYSSVALLDNGMAQLWGSAGNNIISQLTNLEEVAVGNNAYPYIYGLQTDGTPVVWGAVVSASAALTNALAHMSNIVQIEADNYGSAYLNLDGTVTRLDNSGNLVPTKVGGNFVALAQLAGSSGFTALRVDGTVYDPGIPTPLSSNVLALAAAPNGGVVLKRDGSIVSWGYTNAPTSNIIDVATTLEQINFAVRSDGTITNWGYPNYAALNVPAGLGKVSVLDGGPYHCVALLTTNDFPPVFLPDALDTTELVVSSKNGAQWHGQTRITHDGKHAARSAAIGRNTASSMRMLATNGTIRVSFWWKVSSATNHGVLTFSIGGVPQAAISGEVDWQQVTFDVPAGPQMLVWTYSKDSADTSGMDAGFVDQLTFTPIAPTITSQPASQTIIGGPTAVFTAAATGTAPLSYRWFNVTNSTAIASAPGIFRVAPTYRSSSGTFYLVVTNSYGSDRSTNFSLTVRVPQRIGLPLLQPDGTFLLTSQDADQMTFPDGTDLSGFQAQYSSNLIDWLPLTTALTVSNGLIQVNDVDSTNAPQRFYRIIENW